MTVFLLVCLLFLIQARTGAADCSPYCSDPPEQGTCCQRLQVIQDSDVTASTSYSRDHIPSRAALVETDNNQPSGGIAGWAPGSSNEEQWIQVDFGSPRRVTGVLLQGGSLNAGDKQWVKSFKVLFRDGEFEESDSTPVINGTFDRDTVVRRYLDPPITARFFRIKPVTWSGYITLRFDLLGCDV